MFGVLTDREPVTLKYHAEVKEKLDISPVFKGGLTRFTTTSDGYLFLFRFPVSVHTEVIIGFLGFVIVASAIIRALSYQVYTVAWFQYVLVGIMLLVAWLNSDPWFFSLFKYGLRKKGYQGSVKWLSPSKVLELVMFK